MLEHEEVKDLVMDLEQRIDTMQDMGDAELGTIGRLDWIFLIVISIIIPVIVVVIAR